MELKNLTWEQVKPIWDTKLWPGRDSEPVTSMKYLGGYDMSLKEREPFFIGVVTGEYILAVNSYVRTGETEWRSRGLWVDQNFRRQGHAKMMLASMAGHIQNMQGTMIWTMPRTEALEAYQSVGFVRTSNWIEQDWGTNCYALMSLLSLVDLGREATRLRERRIAFFREHMQWPLNDGALSTEDARRLMKPLADLEEAEWR